MSHPVPTVRGPYHPYKHAGFTWQPFFNILSRSKDPPSIRSVSLLHRIPYRTLQRRFRQYEAALANNDKPALARARGEVDGRRDNSRVFSREEEEELKAALGQENVHPNKPIIRQLALRIHKQHEKASSPAQHIRSQSKSGAPFLASDTFVHRVKQVIKQSDKKVKIRRRHKRAQPPDAEERKVASASEYLEDVAQAVETYGPAYTINADEISGRIISPPRTLWAPVNGPQPVISSNHTEKEAFTLILATTAAGHKLPPACFVQGQTDRVLRPYAAMSEKVKFFVAGRWVNQEMWERYLTEVIVPFCAGRPAALVVDSHSPHISDLSATVAAEHEIFCIQVPPGSTAELQPNDVGVYGALTSMVKAEYLDKIRSNPAAFDGQQDAVARYLHCWQRLNRDWIRKAWVESNPLLRGKLYRGRGERD